VQVLKFAFLIFKVFEYGGAQRDMLRIAHDLVALGHQVTIFTGEWRGESLPKDLNYRVLPIQGFANHQRHKNLIVAMQRELAAGDFDFVVGFNRIPHLDAYYAADPCFVARAAETRGWWYRLTARYKFFAASEAAVFGAQGSTHILLLTQRDGAVFQHYYKTPASRFHAIPPNIPTQKFTGLNHAECREYLRQEFALPVNAKIVMTVGSAYLRKGVDRAMLALASLPSEQKGNTWLISLGELESASTFKQDAKKLGIAEHCIEAGGRPDVAKLMMGADVLVHPARSELAGIVLMEALVAQLPVIVTDVCGYANHIGAAGGVVLSTPYSQTAMNDALAKLLSEDNANIKQNAKTYIQTLVQNALPQTEANILINLAKEQVQHVLVERDSVTLPAKLLKYLPQSNLFDYFMGLQGKVFRDVPGRKTMQIQIDGKSYFIKQHFGVGWSEVFKNWLTFKKPILSAMTEVNAIQKLNSLNIATTPLVAYGEQGCNPATMRSFVLTEDLGDIINLEELSVEWPEKSAEFRQALMQAIGALAGKLHGAGLCHRDFYLCHFVLKKVELAQGTLNLHLIDLHRMLQDQPSNGSAVMKDIAGLYFSAKQCGLSADDLAIFRQHYLPRNEHFWQQVEARAEALLSKFNSDKFQAKLAVERRKLS